MSLVRMVTRLVTVAALRDKTWAGDRVYNSDNVPLAQALLREDAPKPYIVVFTDNDVHTDISATELYDSTRQLNLVIEIAVASIVEGPSGVYSVHLPQTDAGMESALDITEGQTIAAILGDPRSEWGELFRLLVGVINRTQSIRAAQAARGSRWAARQLIITCEPVFDHPPGDPYDADHPVRLFIDLARANPEVGMVDAADLVEKLLSNETFPSWERDQAWLGLTRRGIRGVGYDAPLAEIPVPGGTGGSTRPFEVEPSIVDAEGQGPEMLRLRIEQETDGHSDLEEGHNPDNLVRDEP